MSESTTRLGWSRPAQELLEGAQETEPRLTPTSYEVQAWAPDSVKQLTWEGETVRGGDCLHVHGLSYLAAARGVEADLKKAGFWPASIYEHGTYRRKVETP